MIEKDREYGYLRATARPEVMAAARRRTVDGGSVSGNEVLDFLEDIYGRLGGRKLLDIGCREGDFLDLCNDRGIACTGWEEVFEWSKSASAKGHRILTADLASVLERAGRKYDIVTLFNVLQYLENPARALFQIRTNLLSGHGALVVTVPNTFSLLQTVAREEFDLKDWWVSPDTISNYFTLESLTDLLEGCGFNVVDVYSDVPREMFMLAEDPGGSDPLDASLRKKCRFDEVIRKLGKQKEFGDFKRALGRLALGGELVTFAKPNAFSKSCRATFVKNWAK